MYFFLSCGVLRCLGAFSTGATKVRQIIEPQWSIKNLEFKKKTYQDDVLNAHASVNGQIFQVLCQRIRRTIALNDQYSISSFVKEKANQY